MKNGLAGARTKTKTRIQQRIYLSRRAENSIEFEHEVLQIPLSVGEETSFELLIFNYGRPSHIHLSLSDEIKDRVMLLQEKTYVIDEEKIAAIARLPKSYAAAGAGAGELDEDSGIGEISVSTGYGAVKESFMVEIVPVHEEVQRQSSMKRRVGEREREREREQEQGDEQEGVRELKREHEEKKHHLNQELVRYLSVNAVSTALFLLSLFIISISAHPFPFAIIASALFLFIVIYNM